MFDRLSARNMVHRQLKIMSTSSAVPSEDGFTDGLKHVYIYRTFNPPAKEAVVVGVNITLRDDGFIDVEGDICKEDSGKLFYRTSIARTKGAEKVILSTVKRITEELSRHAAELRIALTAEDPPT